jgi:hypothetical protein
MKNLFHDNYRDARDDFLAIAKTKGWDLQSFDHPEEGPHGGTLAADVAYKADADVDSLLLTISGTHGIEGAAGSACQLAWLSTEKPENVAIVHVHAINPYGFAWRRRVDHRNIDVNRNFVDFEQPLPANPSYDELADSLAPDIWDDISDQISRIAWRDFIARKGEQAFAQAIMLGQYHHPQGLYFGGNGPSWSRRTFHQIVERHGADRKNLLIIDLHSGLGARGQADLICRQPDDSDAMRRARRWFGEKVHAPVALANVPAEVSGALRSAPERWLPNAEVTALAVEFGTYPADKVFDAIRADNWLHHHGDLSSPRGQAIKATMREMFCPRDPLWQEQVISQAIEIQEKAIRALKA